VPSDTVGSQRQTRATTRAQVQSESQQQANTEQSQSQSHSRTESTSRIPIATRARSLASGTTQQRINSSLNTQRQRSTSLVTPPLGTTSPSLPLNLQPLNPPALPKQQTSSMSPSMPRPGSRDAPVLTVEGTDDPLKVRRYFEELEDLFTDSNITDEKEKKKWSCRYPDGAVSWEWKALPESLTDATPFLDFKNAVLASYPGASDEERGTIRELNRLFKKYKNIDSSDLDEYLALIRKFRAIKLELNPPSQAGAAVQVEPLVTNRELVEKFTGALDVSFRSAILSALRLKGKTRKVPAGLKARQDDMYEIDDVISQGEEIVRGTMPGTDPLSYESPRTMSSSSTSKIAVKPEYLQQQVSDLISEKMAVLLDTIKINQEQLRHENSKQLNDLMRTFQQSTMDKNAGHQHSNPQNSGGYSNHNVRFASNEHQQNRFACFFCNEEGHMRDDCPHKADLIELGRIVVVNGRVRLPGNYPIPREPVGAVCEKDWIDYYYASKEKNRSVNFLQSTPANIPGILNTATMSTYLSNQLDDRDVKIAQLERELQGMRTPHSQMYNVSEPSAVPSLPLSQFSQVGWTPPGNQYMSSMAPPMNQFLNQSPFNPNMGMNYNSQPMNSIRNVTPMTQLVQQNQGQMTLNELEAFVQTRRQQEQEKQEK
jgi:hypothetical protein